MARSKAQDHITQHHKKKFLDGYLESGTVTGGCSHAGVNRSTFYRWYNTSAIFKEQFDAVECQVADKLEQEAIRRAHDGVKEPVFYKGKEVGTIRRYSDTLLIFLLKGLKPERYRERQEITGPGGGPIQYEISVKDKEAAELTNRIIKGGPVVSNIGLS